MSEAHPRTVEEWRAHLSALAGEALREKAIAANSVAFVRALQEEGYSAEDIEAILRALARRFVETGQRAPSGGLYDFDALARE